MRLPDFIRTHMEPILRDWEEFAVSLGEVTRGMDSKQLRNHAAMILEAIADDMESDQSLAQQKAKSHGRHADRPSHPHDAVALSHGSVRALEGFTLDQMVSEYRALRASVLRLWAREHLAQGTDQGTIEAFTEMVRFNEAVDEALTDSIQTYSLSIDHLFAAKAKRRMEAMGTLAAGLGHDMANVLVPMRHCLMTLSTKGVSDDQAPLIDALQRAMGHLSGLTKGLRAFSMDPETTAGLPQTTVLSEWWATAISPFTWSLPKGVQLHVDGLGPESPALPAVRVPAHVLMQATFNLVHNAGHALMHENLASAEHGTPPKGNIWIAARLADARDTPSGTPMVFLTVRDDGPGMDQATIQRCTDPFFTTKSPNFGSGLGLHVVRTVLERHGASLGVASRVGEGSTFTVRLPVVDEDVAITVSGAGAGAKKQTR